MRILIINWEDRKNPLAGGAETHLHEVFSRIATAGHEVILLCSHFAGAPFRETLDGLEVHRTGHFKSFNYEMPMYYRRYLAKHAFDLIVDDINKIPFCTPLWLKRPILALAHHFFGSAVYHEVSWPYATYVYLWEQAIPLVYRRTPFIVGSEHTKNELLARRIPEAMISIVNYGLDPAQYHLNEQQIKSDTPLIVHFGRLKRYKSVDVIIRAMTQVKTQIPTARLVIVGEGDDRPRLQELTAELGLSPWVKFTGFVDQKVAVEYLQQAWIVVNGSIKEGWGLTVIEANACGTPVIAADSPGLRESVVHNQTGWLVPYGDVDAFARQMIQALENHPDRAIKTREALTWAARFRWDTAAQQTLAIMEQIIGR